MLTGPALSGTLVTHTDETGAYSFPFIPPGRGYWVRVDAAGYGVNLKPVILDGSQTITFNLYMDAWAGAIIVHRDSAMLDYTQAK